MEQKEHKKGVLGVVADLFKVEKAYETAIETALGGSVQNIVTDTEQTAKELIEYLKRNKFGRATFLPLTSIKGSTNFGQEVLSEPGVVGIASSLVTVDEMYKNLSLYLLGRKIGRAHV